MRNLNGHSIYEFGEFVLDVDKLMLYRDEAEISLPPKVVKTLAVLVENRGEILSKDELMEKVWEGSVVEESNLSQYLYLLRKTVGNRPDGNPYIETLRRRGYRFTGNVKVQSTANGPSAQASLPRPSLIGREREVGEIISLLSRDDVRVVTVSGVGGVGKTTLARAVADQWTGDHEIFFVEVAPITDPAFVISAIASALGVKESAEESLLDRIKSHLRSGSYLLVLDNFEQVPSAASILTELVDADISDLKIIVTSRVALHIDPESVYILPPLQVPTSESLDETSRCDSVKLFVERAKTVQPRFELTRENVKAVAGICNRLEGLPLAIELAAARMKLLTPEAVLNRLEKQLDVLRCGSSEAPQRQKTMRKTIAWSFDLLTDREKQVFARLGVFSGGFDLEAAEMVVGASADETAVSVLDPITSLVEQNLLVARTAKNGDPRVYMLEVVREFALETLAECDETEAVRRTHAEYFQHLGESAEPQLVAARSAEWLDRLETEHDNVRAALAWSRLNDPLIGQRLAGAIWRFWWLHGHIREACEQLDDFLDIPSTDPLVRAKMLTGATFLHRLAGSSERSRRYAEEGAELSDVTGDLRNGALAFNQLGFLALDSGDLAEAERMFSRGLKKAESLGDIQVLALVNNGLGELSRMKGDYDEAAEFYGRALRYNREAGDRVRQTTCLINLGATALMQDDRDAAGSFYREGLEISSEMEDMNGTLYCLEGLAGSYWALRDPERSALLFGAAYAGRQDNNLLLEPADKVPYDRSVERVRGVLGESSFQEGFSDGSKLSLNSATELALEVTAAAERTTEIAPPAARGGRITVERHGNVLRLVDWRETESEPAHVSAAVEAGSLPVAASKRTPVSMLLSVLALVVIAGGLLAYLWPESVPVAISSDRQREMTVTRLTNSNFVWGATISPDGNYFAYSEIDEKGSRLFVQQTGQNSRVELLSMPNYVIAGTTFSPDGRWIYFSGTPRDEGVATLFRIPTIGGKEASLLSGSFSTISFSPDGKEISFMRMNRVDDTSLMVADKDGRRERALVQRQGLVTIGSNAAWSPDGSRIVFSETDRTRSPLASRLKTVDVSTGIVSPLSDELWDVINRIEWVPDGSGIVTNATRTVDRETPVYHYSLYYVSFPEGTSRRITNDGNRHDVSSLGIAKDGSLLAVPTTRACQIWSLKATGDAATAVQLTRGSADGRAGLVSLPDGRIAYTARTAEHLTLWTANADGSEPKQLATGFDYNEELRADPTGRFLVFSTTQDSAHHLFRINPDGSDLRQLTFGKAHEIDSAISPDGKTIVTYSNDLSTNPPKTALKKLSSEGGEPQILPVENCHSPVFSPDGSMLSCVRNGNEALIVKASDGLVIESLPFPTGAVANFGAFWTPDATGLIVMTHEQGMNSNLTVIPRDRSKPYKLTNFTSGTIFRFAFSGDGSRLLVARGYPTQDAVLIRNAF